MDRVNWGVVGLGKIAHRFVNDLTQHCPNAQLVAVAASNKQRAQTFANDYHCSRHYGDYLALAKDPEIHIVYVATIHPLHAQLTKIMLEHGKHVIVEKPAFTNYQNWQELSSLAKTKGLLLVEAMKTAVFPAYQALKQFIVDRNITLTHIEAAFGNSHHPGEGLTIFNPEESGGATLDVAVYPLWLYHDLASLNTTSSSNPTVTIINKHHQIRVDQTIHFNFTGKMIGNISASITEDLKREAVIQGEDFTAVIKEKWWNPHIIDITYQGKYYSIKHTSIGGGFEHEINHVTQLLQEEQTSSPILRHEISTIVIQQMEQALIQNGYEHLTKSKLHIIM